MKIFLLFLLSLSEILSPTSNSITGVVKDAESGETIPFVYLHLEEIHRSAVADANGAFAINNVPSGEYTLTIHHLGYRTQSQNITIGIDSEEADLELEIKLQPSTFSSQAIEVRADRDATSGSNLEHASQKFFGSDLRRDLGSTLAQTLSNLPGFDQRTMGSAPGRPVIRGLGDERVVILQDGITSGDVSAQSGDHAVTIDPVSAQEVEVARGPAALQYGANAIGGVINVVRNHIATSMPNKTTGIATLNGETVNSGLTGAFNLTVPAKSLVFNIDLNGRLTQNTQTPQGELDNSYFRNTNDAAGISWIHNNGYVGGSIGTFRSHYGIPPEPNGHPNGVDIEMNKYQIVLKTEYVFKSDLLRTFEADYSLNNYNHKEFESSNVIGTEFGLVTSSFNAVLKHNGISIIDEGRIGINLESLDYAVSGAGTPASNQYSFAGFVIEETDIGAFHLEAGLRFDFVRNAPKVENPDARIGDIRARDFMALSSSVSGIYNINSRLSTGITLLHSFRAPSLEELYSLGPHLASYSYEIGNPELDPERGLAKELFIRYNGNRTLFEIAGYHNGFSNYLYAQNTGQRNNRFPNLNDYQFIGTQAELYGFELSAEQQLSKQLLINGSMSYTIGNRDSTVTNNGSISNIERPLAQVPPFKAKLGITYANTEFEFGTRYRFAAEQQRTGEFETSTPSYSIVDIFAQYRISSGALLHTFSLNISNLLDETYYNHLSRIKDIRPEAGRNISLLYRLYF
ncbi:MAG: TonB-dependent receptor [Balneolaceae bacterium]|nr:TonB-dependent receptor [Balneolaceae bacterium]